MPFTAGLNQKSDPRALQPPDLSIAVDVEAAEIGGLQTRYPFAAMGTDILGGGTISDPRRIVQNGDELLLFTKSSLYSWNSQISKWVSKGTHLAIKVSEEPVFVATGDQTDCDRAELSGTVVYAWTDAGKVYVAARDKTTGSIHLAPTAISGGDTRSRPKLVALSTKILLFMTNVTQADLEVLAIDPATVGTSIAATPTVIGNAVSTHNVYYDACRIIGADSAAVVRRDNPTTTYTVMKITAALAETSVAKARTADGPVAISSSPDGTHLQIVRGNGTNVQGDLVLVSTLADVYTAQAVGTVGVTINQIAVAHRSVTDSGVYRAYVFWTDGESESPNAGTSYLVKVNWVSTGNTLGSETTLVRALGVASRAFDHEGRVFVNLVFAGTSTAVTDVAYGQTATLQNTYFLYRDDGGAPFAKASVFVAGGFIPSTGHLPTVALTSGTTTYSWCGTERRIIPLGGNHRGYSDRGPRDISYTFDSDEARRCVRLGQTLYIAGGEILQYDGVRLTEVGFHYFPYFFSAVEDLVAGSLANGTYFYKVTPRWDNARGEIDRGTTATHAGVTIGSGPGGVTMSEIGPIHVTHKAFSSTDDVRIVIEIWRTLANPGDDAPYYLVTSKDPTDTTGDNCFVFNSTSLGQLADFSDYLVDDDARERETSHENGGVLENLSPPAATIIAATDTRLFLAGVAGDPDRVWYSKLRNAGEVAAFHDALTAQVPAVGGDITALAFLQETLAVFRETAVYVLPGDGFDNAGGGQNYGPARQISGDIGAVSHEAVAVTDKGLVFKSNKGWYLLNKGWSLEYIGGGVSDYDDEEPLAIDVLEAQHQVRILTSERMLVLDTLNSQPTGPVWYEWSVDDGIHACMWQGAHAYLTTTGPKTQLTTYTGVDYGWDVETAWIKLTDLQGMKRVRWLEILGEHRSSFQLRIRLARDYWSDGVDTYFDDETWTSTPAVVGGPMQMRFSPSIQQVQAIKVRLTATLDGGEPTGEAAKLTGLSFELGFKRGLFRQLPATQKA